MISGLLWRCPVCKENDSILHEHRFLLPDRVNCTKCEMKWELRRNKGGTDFRFIAIDGPMAGIEHPLASWYDMMREGFELVSIPPDELDLEQGEELYLRGRSQNLTVHRKDPRFAELIASLPPAPESVGNPGDAHPMVPLGPVDLALTNQRFFIIHNEIVVGLDLLSFRGIEILLDRIMVIRHEKRLVEILTFGGESPLKWRAYFEKVLQPVIQSLGIKIRMPYD